MYLNQCVLTSNIFKILPLQSPTLCIIKKGSKEDTIRRQGLVDVSRIPFLRVVIIDTDTTTILCFARQTGLRTHTRFAYLLKTPFVSHIQLSPFSTLPFPSLFDFLNLQYLDNLFIRLLIFNTSHSFRSSIKQKIKSSIYVPFPRLGLLSPTELRFQKLTRWLLFSIVSDSLVLTSSTRQPHNTKEGQNPLPFFLQDSSLHSLNSVLC